MSPKFVISFECGLCGLKGEHKYKTFEAGSWDRLCQAVFLDRYDEFNISCPAVAHDNSRLSPRYLCSRGQTQIVYVNFEGRRSPSDERCVLVHMACVELFQRFKADVDRSDAVSRPDARQIFLIAEAFQKGSEFSSQPKYPISYGTSNLLVAKCPADSIQVNAKLSPSTPTPVTPLKRKISPDVDRFSFLPAELKLTILEHLDFSTLMDFSRTNHPNQALTVRFFTCHPRYIRLHAFMKQVQGCFASGSPVFKHCERPCQKPCSQCSKITDERILSSFLTLRSYERALKLKNKPAPLIRTEWNAIDNAAWLASNLRPEWEIRQPPELHNGWVKAIINTSETVYLRIYSTDFNGASYICGVQGLNQEEHATFTVGNCSRSSSTTVHTLRMSCGEYWNQLQISVDAYGIRAIRVVDGQWYPPLPPCGDFWKGFLGYKDEGSNLFLKGDSIKLRHVCWAQGDEPEVSVRLMTRSAELVPSELGWEHMTRATRLSQRSDAAPVPAAVLALQQQREPLPFRGYNLGDSVVFPPDLTGITAFASHGFEGIVGLRFHSCSRTSEIGTCNGTGRFFPICGPEEVIEGIETYIKVADPSYFMFAFVTNWGRRFLCAPSNFQKRHVGLDRHEFVSSSNAYIAGIIVMFDHKSNFSLMSIMKRSGPSPGTERKIPQLRTPPNPESVFQTSASLMNVKTIEVFSAAGSCLGARFYYTQGHTDAIGRFDPTNKALHCHRIDVSERNPITEVKVRYGGRANLFIKQLQFTIGGRRQSLRSAVQEEEVTKGRKYVRAINKENMVLCWWFNDLFDHVKCEIVPPRKSTMRLVG